MHISNRYWINNELSEYTSWSQSYKLQELKNVTGL